MLEHDDVLPIPGAKRENPRVHNAGALGMKINREDLARIDKIIPPGVVAGTRYVAPQMQAFDR